MLSHFDTIDASLDCGSSLTTPPALRSPAARRPAARPPLPPPPSSPSTTSAAIWVTTLEQMLALESDWRALDAKSTGRMSYFQSFDWCYNWYRQFAAGNAQDAGPRLRIFTLRKNGKVEMIWPMMQVTRYFGVKELVFIGEPLTQYGNILINHDRITPDDIRQCWSEIIRTSQADVIALNNFPAQSVLNACCDEQGSAKVVSATSIMDLSGFTDFASFIASLNKTTRRSRSRRRNRLAKLGRIEQVAIAGGSSAYAALVDQALAWKQTWLKETGRASEILQQRRTRAFLMSLEDRVLAFALELNGRPIAIEIGFLDGAHYYSYLGAFDWSFRAYSPGKVQMEETFRWAINNKVKAYDLLGNPSTYKADWSNIDLALMSRMQPLTVKGVAYARGWTRLIKPMMKRSFYWMSSGQRKALLAIVFGLRRKMHDLIASTPEPGRSHKLP